ncbi:MAG: SDR family NAD(P)-dependent oxidoreductase [Gammaproteobacteria bacterium]
MELDLKGRRALVTGGTRGIGRAICESLAAEGCNVALCARNDSQVRETVSSLEAAGVTAYGEAVDITHETALTDFVASSSNALGGLDILVPNVSALATGNSIEDWKTGVEVDLLGTVRTVDAALPFLRASDAGAIVIISSTAAVEIYVGLRPYNSIKAALITYVKGLSLDLAPSIRVNAVSPGAIYFEGGIWHRIERERPAMFEDMVNRNPLGRLGMPEDIGRAVTFLASPAASYVTGSNLMVDGGMTKRVQY